MSGSDSLKYFRTAFDLNSHESAQSTPNELNYSSQQLVNNHHLQDRIIFQKKGRNLSQKICFFPPWEPTQLIEKIEHNGVLDNMDHLVLSHPLILKYASWLEEKCIKNPNATSREILIFLYRKGCVKVNQYHIWL